MSATAPELAGMLAGCGAAATALVAADSRLRRGALAAALILAPILVAASVWNEPRVVLFREDGAAVAVMLAAALLAIGALAVLFRRFPPAFPVLALALLSLRIPVEIGGERANLLIPLYAVIAAGAVATMPGSWRRAGDAPSEAWMARPRGAVDWLRWLLAGTLVVYAAQSAYSDDVGNAIETAGFFLIPFAAMFSLLAEVEWSRRLLGLALAAVAAMAAVFAAVAIYQYAARDLFVNEELLESNQLHQYFRVNSLFYDPNILGRYLALALTALAAYIAWGARLSRLAIAAALGGLIVCGMALSFSITSFGALLAALSLLAVLRWGVRGGVAAAALASAALLAFVLGGGAPASDLPGERPIDSGRTDLVTGGIELARERPLAGWGSGSFGAAFSQRFERTGTTVSHSEPVTVAAEQGAIGLLVYMPLVVVALLVLLSGARGGPVGRAAVAACFVAMLVHSLGYAGFAIDPATWALLALGASLRGAAP